MRRRREFGTWSSRLGSILQRGRVQVARDLALTRPFFCSEGGHIDRVGLQPSTFQTAFS